MFPFRLLTKFGLLMNMKAVPKAWLILIGLNGRSEFCSNMTFSYTNTDTGVPILIILNLNTMQKINVLLSSLTLLLSWEYDKYNIN